MVPVHPWEWAGLGVILMLLEVFHGAFVLSVLGASALVTAAVDVLFPSLALTLVTFGLLAVLGLWLLRPQLLRRVRGRAGDADETNVAALVGSTAHVQVPFDDEGLGRVRVGAEEWRARLRTGALWTPGTPLTVVGSSGATLEVAPAAPGPPSAEVEHL